MSMHEIEAWRAMELSEKTGPKLKFPESFAEGILEDPPKVILVFDNFRGNGQANEDNALETMQLRAFVGAFLYRSKLYPGEDQKPVLCCLANKHLKNGTEGSAEIGIFLRSFGVPDEKIITRPVTITARTDMTAQHALAKELHTEGPLAIVTSIDNVPRATMAVTNHYSNHKSEKQSPKVYVISAATPELAALGFFDDPDLLTNHHLREILEKEFSRQLNHGITEKIAYILEANRLLKPLQAPAELLTHLGSGSWKQDRARESVAKKMKRAGNQWSYLRKKYAILIKSERIEGFREFYEKHPNLVRTPDMPAHG